MIIDQTKDYSNVKLYHLLRDVQLPDFVKEASLDTTDSLDKEAFADPYHRLYPINTPASVYISNAFFQDKKAEIVDKFDVSFSTAIEESINKAAKLFEIEKDIEAYNKQANEKVATDYPVSYVAEIKDFEDEEFKLFPVKTSEDVKQAAEVFTKNINKYPFEWRKDIANGFINKAAEFGVDELPDLICKHAGMFYPAHVDDIKFEVKPSKP